MYKTHMYYICISYKFNIEASALNLRDLQGTLPRLHSLHTSFVRVSF